MPALRWMVCLALLLLAAAAARAETFTNADNAFSLELPDDWSPLDPADVPSATQALSPDAGLHCFAGFTRGNTGVLLISATPYPESRSYSHATVLQIQQLAAELTGALIGEFRSSDTPATPAMGAGAVRQITCFTQPPGFAVDYQQVKKDMRSHSVAFMGQNRLVMLHFFMTPLDYPFTKRSMDEIAASFHFDRREALPLQTTFASPDDYTAYGTYGFTAFALLVAAWIVRYLFKRKAY